MILDNETQKKLLLQMFGAVNFPGNAVDEAFALKQAIANAEIKENEPAKD